MKKGFLALLLPLLLTGAGPLHAQTEAGELKDAAPSMYLDTVVVTADRHDESLREVSQSMVVIEEKEIQNSAATDPTDLLKKYGIQVNQSDGAAYGQDSITIRGFSSSYHGNDINSNVLILVDGRRAVGDSMGVMSLNNIARVEIIRGPGAMQYGSSAMGGVVNFITKRGKEDPNLYLEAGFGSFSRQKYSFFGSGMRDKLDAAVAVNYEKVGDYKDGAGVQHKHSGQDGKWGYQANLGWNFNENHRLGFSVQGSKLEDAGKGFLEGSARSPYHYRFLDKEVNSVDLLYEGATGAGDKSWLARYYQGISKYDLNRLYVDGKLPAWVHNSSSETDFKGAQAQLTWDWARVSLTGGVDWIEYDMKQNQYPTPGNRGTSGPNWSDNKGDYENFGAFLMGKVYILEDKSLILSGGLRYDEYDVKMNNTANQYYTAANSPTGVAGYFLSNKKVDKTFDKVLPSVGLVYNPTNFLKLRANYAQAYKVPTPRELAGNYNMMYLFLGNPDLEPEESETLEGGFDLDYDHLVFSGTYFHTKYKNYMAYGLATDYGIPGASGQDKVYFNVDGDSTISGLELGLRYNVGRKFGWGADFIPYLNWTHLTKYEADDGRKLPNIAEDSLGFGAEIAYEPFGFTLNLDGTYYGSRAIDKFEAQEKYEKWTGGATVWDLSVIKHLWEVSEKGDLKLKFAAKNIFDKEYGFEDGFTMQGSSVYLGLIYEYK